MNLERMRERCARDQWQIDDLDWSVTPRPMEPDEERTVVQYFTDMAGIEMLAGELFRVQRDRTSDPVLREIFASFVVDEVRHAAVASRLAQHYDVHHFEEYRENPHLTRFRPYFVAALKELSAEIANAYITGGELLLDVALLRSLNDYVHDAMSERAMELINRDESRHIAMDFHMIEFYASEEYQYWLAQQPRSRVRELTRASWALGNMLRHAAPFFQDVFFTPLKRMDPSGKRMREAYKRLQLVSGRDRVRDRPFWRAVTLGREVFTHPVLGPALGKVAQRVAGLPEALMQHLYDERELEAARHASIESLVEETVGMKYSA
jgi:hypothetical protein